jgi:cyclophilin family peptidyl-prolyl cis-trans isomerase
MPAKRYSTPPPMQIDTNRAYRAIIKTNKGDIHLQLNPSEAPLTVNNFVALAREGYYDGVTFHRVVPRFVIQGGDPTGTGSGGPGYQFQDEPVKRPYKAGTVAMANAGPNTNGSQFFICLEDQPNLPPNYTIFGDTVAGMDVVHNIRVGDVMQSVTIE